MIDIGASTLIKYGLAILAAVSFCVGLILYGEHRKQIEWDASMMEQAKAVAADTIEKAQEAAKVQVRYIERAAKIKTVEKIVNQEVVRYVETPSNKCILSPSFERNFDRISGVLGAGADALQPADTAPSQLDVPSDGPPVTDAEILQAYYTALTRWRERDEQYRALSEWVEQMHSSPAP